MQLVKSDDPILHATCPETFVIQVETVQQMFDLLAANQGLGLGRPAGGHQRPPGLSPPGAKSSINPQIVRREGTIRCHEGPVWSLPGVDLLLASAVQDYAGGRANLRAAPSHRDSATKPTTLTASLSPTSNRPVKILTYPETRQIFPLRLRSQWPGLHPRPTPESEQREDRIAILAKTTKNGTGTAGVRRSSTTTGCRTAPASTCRSTIYGPGIDESPPPP